MSTKKTETPDWRIIRRPGSPVLFFIVILTVLGIGWVNDYNSCLRQQRPRDAVKATTDYFMTQAVRLEQRATIDTGEAKMLDIRGAMSARKAAIQNTEIKHLKCLAVFPPTD